MGIAGDAAPVAQRLRHRLADRDAAVFGGVVEIDMQIAFGTHGQIDQAVTRQLVQHVIEESDAGLHVITALAVEVDSHGNLRLAGVARDRGGALAHLVSAGGFCRALGWWIGIWGRCMKFRGKTQRKSAG